MSRRPFFRRPKSCPFSGENAPTIGHKNVKLLQRFTSERQDRAEPYYRGIGKKTARACDGYQACPQSCPDTFYHQLRRRCRQAGPHAQRPAHSCGCGLSFRHPPSFRNVGFARSVYAGPSRSAKPLAAIGLALGLMPVAVAAAFAAILVALFSPGVGALSLFIASRRPLPIRCRRITPRSPDH